MSMKDICNTIVLASEPKGKFIEGIISGTPKPGTLMQVKAATEPVGGRLTFEVFNGAADGERTEMLILREDYLQGKGVEDAYEDGKRGFLYVPAEGEDMLVRVSAPGTGTGDSLAIGAKLIADDGTGLFIATTGSPESEPFVVAETMDDVEAGGTLVHCRYTGR